MRMNIVLVFFIFFIPLNAQSALINTDDQSFIDSLTGLEWIDFGATNNLSYLEVVSELNSGGRFSGWRLPTAEEVHAMWASAIAGPNLSTVQFYPPPLFDQEVYDPDRSYRLNSSFEYIFDIIGFNEFRVTGGDEGTYVSLGKFQGFNGLASLEAVDRPYQDGYYGDYLRLTDLPYWSSDYYYNESFPSYSTLLVRQVFEPPVLSLILPSILFLFLVGIRGNRAGQARG